MKLKLIKYYTMNSWNRETAPAYNLKVYNVIPEKYIDRVYQLLGTEEFYEIINELLENFNITHQYQWQAGFNGASGGYLVLYSGGINDDGRIYTRMKGIEINEVPEEVLKDFEQLAKDIVETTIELAEKYEVVEDEILVPQKVKILREINQ